LVEIIIEQHFNDRENRVYFLRVLGMGAEWLSIDIANDIGECFLLVYVLSSVCSIDFVVDPETSFI
jgi:hypothetical protein